MTFVVYFNHLKAHFNWKSLDHFIKYDEGTEMVNQRGDAIMRSM